MTDDCSKILERFHQQEEITTTTIKTTQYPSTSSINMIQQLPQQQPPPLQHSFPILSENPEAAQDDNDDDDEDSLTLFIPSSSTSNNKKVSFSSSNNQQKQNNHHHHQQQPNQTSSSTTSLLMDNNIFSLSSATSSTNSTTIPDFPMLSSLNSNNSSESTKSSSELMMTTEEEEEDDDEIMINHHLKSLTTGNGRRSSKQNFLLDEEEEETVDESFETNQNGFMDDGICGLSIKTKSSVLLDNVTNPQTPLDNNYSKPKPFLLDSPQVQSPYLNSFSTTPKLNMQNKHLRNMSDISVYSNQYDDELDPSLISKYFNLNNDTIGGGVYGDDDELEDDFEYNERLYSSSNIRNGIHNNHNFELTEEEEERRLLICGADALNNGDNDGDNDEMNEDDDEFSSIFVKVNTNIKRQVNKIGGEETRPEAIPTVQSSAIVNNSTLASAEDDDFSILFGGGGKNLKIPPRSSQSGKSNLGIVKFFGSIEGRKRSISDVSSTIAKIPTSQLTLSAITPPSNDGIMDNLIDQSILLNSSTLTTNSSVDSFNNSSVSASYEINKKHLRMRAESIKLMESLGIDNDISGSNMKIPEITLERQRIAFLTMYSSSHRAKYQEESSLVIQSLFRGYVERKKLMKGLVFMSYICTACYGRVNRMKRECAVNSIEMIRAALIAHRMRLQFQSLHHQLSSPPPPSINSPSPPIITAITATNVHNNHHHIDHHSHQKVTDNVNNISLTNNNNIDNSTTTTTVDDHSTTTLVYNEEKLVHLQALIRGQLYKLSNQVQQFKIQKRLHLLSSGSSKTHPLIRNVYKSFMDIIVGSTKWNISNRNYLTMLDNQKTTNIIAGSHPLYPSLLENLYQLISCNTKNKYWVMRRSLYDLMSENHHSNNNLKNNHHSNHGGNAEFEKILEDFNQFVATMKNQALSSSSSTVNSSGSSVDLSSETSQMKLLIEFLLDQGNVLPKILFQLMIPIGTELQPCTGNGNNRNLISDFFQSPFISSRNSKRSLAMLLQHQQQNQQQQNHVNSFSTLAKQSYNEKSPMSNDAFVSDFVFLCEELSRVFFEMGFKPILFEKRLFQFHSTVCHLLDLLSSTTCNGSSSGTVSNNSNGNKKREEVFEMTEIYRIVLQKLLPCLYSLISLELSQKIDTSCSRSSSGNSPTTTAANQCTSKTTLWDYIQQLTSLESVISQTNSMNFITISLPTTTNESNGKRRRKSTSSKALKLSRSQKTLKLEMSKEKFTLFASIGLANQSLDQYIGHMLNVFSRDGILKIDSPLCSPNMQSSVVAALRSLQLSGGGGNFATLITKNE